MIETIEFNTRDKAEKCLDALGERGIDIITIHYNDEQLSGYIVRYFTQGAKTK